MADSKRSSETAGEFVHRVLEKWLRTILVGDAVAVPDDDEEMNWRLFFAHSQDMQGFAADIFTGGKNERSIDGWTGLRDRWTGGSHALIADLARVWELHQGDLKKWSHPHKPKELSAKGVGPLLDLLENSKVPGAQLFASMLREFKGDKIARKTNKLVRAYVENAAFLKPHGFSYRSYLASLCPSSMPPRGNVTEAEVRWVSRVDADFYNVGEPVANYMVCDWLLSFWIKDEIDWFASFKADSVQKKSLAAMLDLPQTDRAFVDFCRSLRVPSGFDHLSDKALPPRLLNECIWLEGNQSSKPRATCGAI
jgi:hypothetical protein